MKIDSAEFIKGIRGTNPILYDGVPQIVFLGRSNVGKSSTINALLGSKDLVKVSARPGKTTEINFFKINKSFYLVDLPGYGYAKMNMKKGEKLKKLILWYFMFSDVHPVQVVLILDVKAGLTDFDKEMLKVLEEYNHPYLIVVNKVDKLNQKDLSAQLKKIAADAEGAEIIPSSAFSRNGTAKLGQRVFEF